MLGTRGDVVSYLFVTIVGLVVGLFPAAVYLEAQEIDLVELTTDDVQAGYAAGNFTAVELTQAFLDRIERYEPYYNAFISMNPDALNT